MTFGEVAEAAGNWYLERNAMKKHLLTLLMSATAMVASQPVRAQSVVASHDAFGHPVFTDRQDEATPSQQPRPSTTSVSGDATTGTSSRYSGLVYWSNNEHRWKPVPLNNSSTMKAARQAALTQAHAPTNRLQLFALHTYGIRSALLQVNPRCLAGAPVLRR